MRDTTHQIIDIINIMKNREGKPLLDKNNSLYQIQNGNWVSYIPVFKNIILENYKSFPLRMSYKKTIEKIGKILKNNLLTKNEQTVCLGKRKAEISKNEISEKRIKTRFENSWHYNKKTQTAFQKLKNSITKIDPKMSLPIHYPWAIRNIYTSLACWLEPEKVNSAVLPILNKNIKTKERTPTEKNEFALGHLEKLLNITSTANKEISERIDAVTQKIEYKIAEKINTQQISKIYT